MTRGGAFAVIRQCADDAKGVRAVIPAFRNVRTDERGAIRACAGGRKTRPGMIRACRDDSSEGGGVIRACPGAKFSGNRGDLANQTGGDFLGRRSAR
jgi:hypothetical protein